MTIAPTRRRRPTRPSAALGEVGLSGEVRRIAGVERRLAEAARLGFGLALVPVGAGVRDGPIKTVEVATVAQALALLGVRVKPRDVTSIDTHRPQLAVAESA